MFVIYSILSFLCYLTICSADWSPDLHSEMTSHLIAANAKLREECEKREDCPLTREELDSGKCMGWESGCPFEKSYSKGKLSCNLPSSWKGDKQYQMREFFKRGDFGYVRERSILHEICVANNEEQTTLECSDQLRHCFAKNIFFDFQNLNLKTSKRYREDVIQRGQVGGNCGKFFSDVIHANSEHKGYLQSWTQELMYFQSNADFRVDYAHCDIIFERPTILIKLDASVNMYHHFCDFFNLFASQLINGTFDRNIDIVWWDTDPRGFVDPFFGATWKAFSNRKPVELSALDGQRVCFKNALLPMLARQRGGLFYNTPLMPGCSGSGLFHAFSHHILHRLNIEQKGPVLDTVRITLLSRSTPFRKIINEKELIGAMNSIPNVLVKRVDYNGKYPFLNQLATTHNSDIFIGMHGSGLTHLLFLPDWAGIFEVYNCGDANCYYDLARLRGVKYWTWQKANLVKEHGEGKHPTNGTPHKKFTNFSFDVGEFVRVVKQMVEYVRRHPKFVEEQRKLRRTAKTKGEL